MCKGISKNGKVPRHAPYSNKVQTVSKMLWREAEKHFSLLENNASPYACLTLLILLSPPFPKRKRRKKKASMQTCFFRSLETEFYFIHSRCKYRFLLWRWMVNDFLYLGARGISTLDLNVKTKTWRWPPIRLFWSSSKLYVQLNKIIPSRTLWYWEILSNFYWPTFPFRIEPLFLFSLLLDWAQEGK